MLQQERRSSGRKPPAQLAYIRLPSDNGGIVLDISEGGLGFHAVAPVEAGQSIHFRLSMKPVSTSEAVGEVVWQDETGKSGGLRFTHLPEEVREQIRAWSVPPKENQPTEVTAKAAPAVQSELVAKAEAEIESVSNGGENLMAAASVEEISSNATSYTVTANPLSMFPPKPLPAVELTEPVPSNSASSKSLVAILVVAILLASLVAVGVLSYLYIHREAGEPLVRWGNKMWRWLGF